MLLEPVVLIVLGTLFVAIDLLVMFDQMTLLKISVKILRDSQKQGTIYYRLLSPAFLQSVHRHMCLNDDGSAGGLLALCSIASSVSMMQKRHHKGLLT